MNKHSMLLGLLLALAPMVALAATARITTQDGTVISGEIVSLSNGVYTIKTLYGTITVPAASIRGIDTGEASVPAPKPVVPSAVLRLAGSTTIGDELAPALLEAFAASKGASDLSWTQEQAGPSEQLLQAKGSGSSTFTAHLSRKGSGTAFAALAAGDADIGMASRRINPKEIEQLAAAGLGNFVQPGQENVLALDGLAVIVNAKNAVDTLSIGQLKDIFSGRVTDWSQVGGKPGPIHPIGRDTKSGTYDTFNALVMTGTPFSKDTAALDSADLVSEKVQGDPGGIGYSGFAYVGSNKALNIATECGLTFPASELFVRMEEYPLSRRLFLYMPTTPANADAQGFVTYSLGAKGQELAEKKNFVDLVPRIAPISFGRNQVAIDLIGLADDRGAVRDDFTFFMKYARHAVNGNRVSTTFRFQFGSSDLDARAVRDIDRLAEFLKTPTVAGRNLIVAGFADSVGSPARNRALAEQRAAQVASLLRAKGVEPKEVIGYGRVAPVACNSDAEGREKNRRVEIWLD